jgi:hypothetical protein
VFALVGTALGVLGALAVQVTQARSDDLRARREALRVACAKFTAAVARMRNLAIELIAEPSDAARLESLRDTHQDARVHYERLHLTASSLAAQGAGRRVLRYAYGLLRQADGEPPREDKHETGGSSAAAAVADDSVQGSAARTGRAASRRCVSRA